ncbi:hypothetical protein B0H14DRAFT_2620489 [Mycena olivaceomarginata]|nr:hypothetical protein B0H14DRAFT_2620489 [Mycena olivaceomarginata]
MFFNKSLLVASAAVFIGSASAFTGTEVSVTRKQTCLATLGFTGTTNCGCPASNGPSAVSIPVALAGTHVCCQDTITISCLFPSSSSYEVPGSLTRMIDISDNGKSAPAVYNGNYDAGVGTENIELSDFAFAQLEDNSSQTTLSPVTWAFN